MLASNNVVQMPDSVPPQSVDSEIAILSAILASPSCLDGISGLSPEDFYVPVHKLVFELMVTLRGKQAPPDKIHVLDAVRNKKHEAEITKAVLALEQGEGILYISSVQSLADLIKEKSRQRGLVAIASMLGQRVMTGASDTDDLIADTIQQLLELRAQQDNSTISFADAMHKAYEELEAENKGDESIPLGIETGFYDLDNLISTFHFGTLSILGGRGGIGKSTFALELALKTAQKKVNTMFFGLEMTSSQMAKKAIGRLAAPHIPTNHLFRQNKLNNEHWQKIADVMWQASEIMMWLNDDPRITVSGIRSEIQQVVAKYGYVGFVVIDYVQLIRPEGGKKNGTRTEEIFGILQELRAIAKEFNCAILALSQLKRDIDSRNDKRPTLADFGDSSAFDREAACALAIYRDEYYNKDSQEAGIAELIVLKNRFGATGTAKLLFDSQFGEFKNLARGY